jgi:cysteine desulfurase
MNYSKGLTPWFYFDSCATTPCDPIVIEAMHETLQHEFGNPHSGHAWGWAARERVETARIELAQLLSVRPKSLIFTSGATESNQIALFGSIKDPSSPQHIITQVTEHKAILDPCVHLQSKGHHLKILPVDQSGIVDLKILDQVLTPKTALVSIMHVNNELGVIQPLNKIIQCVRSKAPLCWIHIDGAQSVGKIPVNLGELDADSYSLSAHKFYGPKGIGALYIRPSLLTEIKPLFYGGGQERRIRPGTLATHQIVGLGKAAALSYAQLADEMTHLHSLRADLWNFLQHHWPTLQLNGGTLDQDGHPEGLVPGILNVCCPLDLVQQWNGLFDQVGFSQGSACSQGQGGPSHVLTALGRTPEEASRSVRLGLSRFTTHDEVKALCALLRPH